MIFSGDFADDEVQSYGRLIEGLHEVQDAVASMSMDRELIDGLAADLEQWTARLAPLATEEANQVNGRVQALPVRGHAMLPPLRVTSFEDGRVEGTVRFGRWFMGGGMAVHGGVISLLFDEVLGVMSGLTVGGMTRTAYLHTDYRALTPIDVDLDVVAWVDRVEGRKLFIRGEIRQDGGLCAEAEGLFLQLLPGQGTGKRVGQSEA